MIVHAPMRLAGALLTALALWALPAAAQTISQPGGGGALTANSTLTSGFTAGQILISDGTKLQAGGNAIATSLALGGATHVNALDVTGAIVASGIIQAGTAILGGGSTGGTPLTGALYLGSTPSTQSYSVLFNGGSTYISAPTSGVVGFRINNVAGMSMNTALTQFKAISTMSIGWVAGSDPDTVAATAMLSYGGAATIQLGAANVASGAIAQKLTAQGNTGASGVSPNFTISAPNAAGTTSTGGDLILTGGTGTSTNGSVRFGTVAANVAVTAAGTIAIKDAGGTLRYLMYTDTP